MRYFPIYLDLQGHNVSVIGGGEIAVAKIRLLMKGDAKVNVFAEKPVPVIEHWHSEGRVTLYRKFPSPEDLICHRMVYCASGDSGFDLQCKKLASSMGCLTCVVDDQNNSDFITPAIVDRDPVVVAIGTEGSAPVLARSIKSNIENLLSPGLGALAKVARSFRKKAEILPMGALRRKFWNKFFEIYTPEDVKNMESDSDISVSVEEMLQDCLEESDKVSPHVYIVGAGPGDPELMTIKARRLLHDADVVIYDRLIPGEVLELARREALFVEVGKTPGGYSWKQSEINSELIAHARKPGVQHIVRLKSGDPSIFGRLDEEVQALEEALIDFTVVPGVTTASAAAATIGKSLTCRGRNSSLLMLTGHDINGFAEHDWNYLVKRGSVFAVYMGVSASRFLQGRLLLHGADPEMPVSVIENVSMVKQKIMVSDLASLPSLFPKGRKAPTMIIFGIKVDLHKYNLPVDCSTIDGLTFHNSCIVAET